MRLTTILLLFLFACASPSPVTPPDSVLPSEQMVEVLVDIHYLKGKVSVWRLKQEVSQQQEDALLQDIFKKHQLTEADFDSSLSYYSTANAKLLEAIYTQVVEELQKQEADLQN